VRISTVKILAIAQSKGGTGKTTIALNLLAAAAEAGLAAILVDADHHAAGSTVLVGFSPPEWSLSAVLQHNVDPMVVAQRIPEFNCLVLPGSYALSELPPDLPLNALSDCIHTLAGDAGDAGDQAFKPDLAIIDCPGGDVVMNRMALYAADAVAVPMNFSALDLTANETTVNLIAAVRGLRGGRPALAGMIPNRIQRGDSVARDLAFLVASRVPLLPTIPESNLIRRTGSAADLNRRVVVKSHPKSPAAGQFRLLFSVLMGQRSWSREDGLQDLGHQLNMPAGEFIPGLQEENELALQEAAA
jgi:chromosome partitioning protein